jgi:hypothetical protein
MNGGVAIKMPPIITRGVLGRELLINMGWRFSAAFLLSLQGLLAQPSLPSPDHYIGGHSICLIFNAIQVLALIGVVSVDPLGARDSPTWKPSFFLVVNVLLNFNGGIHMSFNSVWVIVEILETDAYHGYEVHVPDLKRGYFRSKEAAQAAMPKAPSACGLGWEVAEVKSASPPLI